jgi:hypothetical protein
MLESHNTLDSTADILKNPNCTIRSCVDLVLWGSCDPDRAMKLMDISPHLLNLTPSSFHLIFWPALDHHAMEIFPVFPSIERLCLDCVEINKFHHLNDLLVKFPNVRELRMQECSMPENAQYTGGYPVLSLRLRSLEFRRCVLDPLLRYFLRARVVPTSHLFIAPRAGEIAIIGEYFSMFGNALQDIRIDLIHAMGEPDTLGACNPTCQVKL